MTDPIRVTASAKPTKKVTIVRKGGLGNVIVEHAYMIDHGFQKYAQYASAVFVKYLLKGKRKPTGFVQGYKPYLVILDGWQEIASQSMWGKTETRATGTTISQAKFSAFDDGWQKEFEAGVELTGVIADYRDHNTYQAIA
jgi:hypothetical protein